MNTLDFYKKKVIRRTFYGALRSILLVLGATAMAFSQASNLIPNTGIALTDANGFDNLSVHTGGVLGSFSNRGNVIDEDTLNSASFTPLAAGSGWIEVRDNNATGGQIYPAGSFAGFVIGTANLLSVGTTIKLTAYNGGTQVGDTYVVPNNQILGLSILGSQKTLVGFHPTGDFNRIRVEFSLIGVATQFVYYAVVKKYEEVPLENIACNLPNTFGEPTFPVSINYNRTGVTGINLGSNVSNLEAIIDNDPNTAASINAVVNVAGTAFVSVKSYAGSYSKDINPGDDERDSIFVGFDIGSSKLLSLDVGILSTITIKTFLNNTEVESKSGNNLLASLGLLSNNERFTIGFITAKEFDEVQLILSTGTVNALGNTSVYRAVFQRFCEGSPFDCNTLTYLTHQDYPVYVDAEKSGLVDLDIIGATFTNLNNIVDPVTTNYATLNSSVDAFGGASVSVKKVGNKFTGGTFAGFDIETVGLIGLSINDKIKISTHIDGSDTPVEEFEGSQLVSLSTSILNGNGRQIIGFKTSSDFDEIRLTISDFATIDLSETRIYGAVVREFCLSTDDLDCNTLTRISTPNNPVFINSINSGIEGTACVACSLSNTENVLDEDPTTYATLILTGGVTADASVSVANALEVYPAKSFAGFEIGTASILDADLLNDVTITLYREGTLVQTSTSPGLILGVNSSILDGGFNRNIIGIVAEEDFDEVQITFGGTLALALGTTRIYNAIVSKSCGSVIACGTSYYLTQPNFPAYINPERTGVSGVLGALGGVKDAWNVVSSDTDDFARLTTDANVAGSTSLSVVDALHVYPKGTIAGFTIVTHPSLVELDLLDAVVISTYLNGQYQESSISANLIDLELLNIPILGPGANRYNLGFITSKPFNEIVISTVSLVKADVFNQIDVYGAYVDTRFSSSGGSLNCVKSNPDINVAYVGIEVEGDVSTNDVVGPTDNVTYTSVAVRSGYTNPSSDMPVLQSDGTYTFLPTTVGRFHFIVNYCNTLPDTTFCDFNYLTITVTDPDELDNPPVINTDIASTVGQTPVTIPVLENDKPGNEGGTLGNITIVTPPPAEQGSVEIVGNNIIFTPAADFFGKVEFQYSACETPSDQCGIADVVVHVYPLGTIGVAATDDYYQTKAGVEFNISAPGILGNDFSLDGGPLTASTLDNPGGRIAALFANNGTISINADGSFTYQSQANFNGTDAFVYQACATGDTCATATIYISVNTADPLPVQLRNFNLSREGTQAHLSWETTEEVKFSHFEVERSFEGKNWHRLTNVTAAGIPSKYHYSDESPADGVNYYRLRMVDQDGSFAYSDVKSLMFNLNLAEVTVSPNPAVDKIRLNIRDLKNVERIQMLSASGQVVYQTTSDFASEINVRHLPAGIYMVVVTHTGGRVTTHKVLKN